MPEHTPIPNRTAWQEMCAGMLQEFSPPPLPIEQELPPRSDRAITPGASECVSPIDHTHWSRPSPIESVLDTYTWSDEPPREIPRVCRSYSHRPRRVNCDSADEEYDNYVSQNGFTEIPLIRGFDVISYLWKVLYDVSNSTKKDCFIAGGYARYCASPKIHPVFPGDIDIYCETERVFYEIKNRLDTELRLQNASKYAIEFVVPENGPYHYMPSIHLIIPKADNTYITMGDKETVLSNFDFSIIRCAIESPTSVLVDVDFNHDESNNILRIKKIRKPVHVLARCLKYATKGYYLDAKEAVKLFECWAKLSDDEKQKYLEEIK